MPLSVLCDEHILFPVIQGLRRRGIDVMAVQEAQLRSASDAAILAVAQHQGRVVYTYDPDFLRLHAGGVAHAGILYHHQDAYSYGEAMPLVGSACESFSPEEMAGRVEFL